MYFVHEYSGVQSTYQGFVTIIFARKTQQIAFF